MKRFLLLVSILLCAITISAADYCTQLGQSTKTDRQWYSIEIVTTGGIQKNIDAYLQSRINADCYRGVLNAQDPVNVKAGEKINLLLNGYMYWTFVHVFADWNCDKDFDDTGEYIEMQPLSKGYFPYGTGADANSRTFNFTVPETATKGATRIRVIMAYEINGACTLTRTTDAAIAADISINIVGGTIENPRTVKVETADATQGSAVITDSQDVEITTDNTSVSVTATPTAAYSFKNWTDKETGNILSTSNPFSYTGTEDITLIANFQDKYVQVTDIPTIFINTENGVNVTSKEDYLNATVTVRGAENSDYNITETVAEIKGRGNSTWGMAKKPYRLKFDSKIQLLGNNAKAKNWVLLANYADKTLMRNALAFETARNKFNFGFTPSVTHVDVVLNGKSLGTYTLTDQVEQDSKRVNIEKQATTVTSTDPEITGGYLVEVDGFADSEISWFKTSLGMKVTIKYPKDDEINTDQSNYISNYTQEMEDALFSTNFTDPTTGWRKYIDETSLADWYIACELFGNSDSWWSTYMYKNRDAIYKLGPIWDFDIAFNNDNRLGDATEKMMRVYAHDPKTWITKWWTDPGFVNTVQNRWRELRLNGLSKFMLEYIDKSEEALDASQKNNYSIWKTLNSRVYLELAARGSYAAEVKFLRDYVEDRIDYLDRQFNLPTGIETATAEDNTNFIIAPNPIKSGTDINIKTTAESQNITITVNSLDGKQLAKQNLSATDNNTISISGLQLTQGVYIISLSDQKGNTNRQKLLVK